MFKRVRHIHFVGIGGAGMSGIAEVLLNLGYKVSGSDLRESETTRRLNSLGGTIYYGHEESNIAGADVVVYSSAVPAKNPEIMAAKLKKIPVIPRAEMLAELMRLKYGIAIAGTHGKTTTTSMTALVLTKGGLDPTVVIGGIVNNLGSNAKLGRGEYLVAEADESDGSFLSLSPTIAVVTSIDTDHLDYYKNMGSMRKAFFKFINKVPFYGCSILCLDDKNIRRLLPSVGRRYLTYGVELEADLGAKNINLAPLGSEFEVLFQGRSLGSLKLHVPGIYNVANSLAAVGVGLELGILWNEIKEALFSFSGVQRRFQILGEVEGIRVMDDYAHHPTAIEVTLQAVRNSWEGRIITIFQPHRYTRTKILSEDFGKVFKLADIVVLTEIYPAGEEPIAGVSSDLIYRALKNNGQRHVRYIPQKEMIVEYLREILTPGDLVITIGAGNIWKVGEELVSQLKGGQFFSWT